ncbi:MAG: YggS family pyridoxal phosphate-dependent enzyme [Myxococcota bacterium]
MAEMKQYAPEQLRSRLDRVRERIRDACEHVGRSLDEVTLVAVSKTHPVHALQTLYDAGHRTFGESYVQEWEDKAPELPDDIEWHFIGHLQSNKAKYLADDVAMVHSVDRKSVMKELNKRSQGRVDVLLQVNIADQDSKSGVLPDNLLSLCEKTLNYPNLRVRGLMTIPPYVDEAEDNREHFARMRGLFDEAREWFAAETDDADAFEHLSMGMTADFEVAVEEGATIVRVGTGIFGQRHYDE